MIKTSLIFLYIFISTLVHSQPIDLSFTGSIIEPACLIFAQNINTCRAIVNEEKLIDTSILDDQNLSIEKLNNFISNYETTLVDLKLIATEKNKNAINLFVTYK
ncbi:hypothetical protein [Acinetobacter equi]|uniref:Uncharacterized protein n=1 Tax=Acinetobacter equi TaxID=1324350 RepID=A0A0N9W1V8_9GAMM|nr:hypothetical protein [Acinetobacter equi]ALH95634.1 hypothetical protein AOY20_08890 [Acinetobacter equi]